MTLMVVAEKSFGLLFDKNDDDVVVVDIPALIDDRFGNVLLSSNECPSDEPLVINNVDEFVDEF